MKFVGYTTEFEGQVKIQPKLHPKIKEFLKKLAETRRMKRNLPKEIYGIEGEFFVDGKGMMGQDHDDPTIIDYNQSPSTQPGLWVQWVVKSEGKNDYIEWDGGEKFYEYVAWLEYIINRVLKPNGYTCNGKIYWRGEEFSDMGTILVKDNEVTTYSGHT